LPCWPVALLARAGLALLAPGVGELAASILEVRGGRREVAIDLRTLGRGIERLAEPVERLTSALRVTLREARHGVPQRGTRRGVGL
jgi:hypothetical protein